jgi:hypothetical protein
MAASTPASTATPILDSAVRRKRKRQNLAAIGFGLLVGIPFWAMLLVASNRAFATRSQGANFIVVTYFLAVLSAIIVHELGHLSAGWLVGFHFSSITIGPVSLSLEYGAPKLRIRRSLPASGYAGMYIDRVRRLRRRLLIFSAAGPLASLLSAAITALLQPYVVMPGTWLSTLADLFWMISLFFGIMSLFPFRLGPLYPDGARVWMLKSSRAKSRRWLSICAIGAQQQSGIRSRELRRTWLDAASAVPDDSYDDFSGNWAAYIAANGRKDEATASLHLERCLALVSSLGPAMRDLVAIEAAVFTAWFRNDADLAEKWRRQIKKMTALPQLMQVRLKIASSCARAEFTLALSRLQDALAIIQKLPETPVKDMLVEGFVEWRDEILEREHSGRRNGDPPVLVQPSAI